jgi:multiple sugar transport system permease protein
MTASDYRPTAPSLPPSLPVSPDAPAQARPPRRRHRPGTERSTVLTVALWACVAYFVLPLVWLAVASTKNNSDLFSSFGFWFGKAFNLGSNLHTLFTQQNGTFLLWGFNTLAYSLTSAVGAAFLSTAAGYGFAMYRFPGGKALFSGVLGSIMIPATALAIPTYLLFSDAKIVNTPLAVILPSLVSPFGVFLMRVYAADAIPSTLLEAARIDGAGEYRIFWKVSARLLGPGIVTVFLFALVSTWNNYFLPLIMLSNPRLFPLTVGLAQLQAASEGGGGSSAQFSTVITGSLVSIVPLIIAFLYLQRYWQSGLATGSVKE